MIIMIILLWLPFNFKGIYGKKLKNHDRKDLLSSKFLDKCKKGCKKVMESFRR